MDPQQPPPTPPHHSPQPPFFLPTTVHPVLPQTQLFPTFPPIQSHQPPPPPPSVEPAPVNHVSAPASHAAAVSASSTAPTSIPPSGNHPPYGEMILAAVTALKERDGSSKRAISKYIERVYTGLPPTHPAMLTHHLKRLKNSGQLSMVKKSYKLPGSDENGTLTNPTGAPVANNASSTAPAPAAASDGSTGKRGRGRPPKPKSAEPISSNVPVTVPVGLSISTQPAVTVPPAASGVPDIGKKRPGRPKKVGGVGVSVGGGVGGVPGGVVGAKRRGRPAKSGGLGVKKSPGRPRKVKSVAANGVKRGPKRLPKSVVVPYATNATAAVPISTAGVAPRPRGRPRKGVVGAVPTAGLVVQGKRPGRPRKVAGGGVVVNPKKRPGRPAGRPRKNANASSDGGAYGELKTKIEFFQGKIRQAVGVIRPQLTNETPISVVIAVQELEGLAAMDISAPLREEIQLPPPPPQQPQPQAQTQQPIIQN